MTAVLSSAAAGADSTHETALPVAKTIPRTLEAHGHGRVDNYYWLRERENPEVLAYLREENRYAESRMAPWRPLQDELFNEIVGRIKKDDSSVPVMVRNHFYYVRFQGDLEYPILCRKKASLTAPEQIILDGNALAKGHSYFHVADSEISSSEDILAFAVDTVGRRIHTLRFRDLTTGKFLADEIPDVTGNFVWAEDNRTLFYSRQDPVTLRSYRIFKHRLGTDPATDVLVYEEKDDTYHCNVTKSKSRRYVFIESEQTLSSEVRYCRADQPDEPFRIFRAREPDHEYGVDHGGDTFFIRTNDKAKNFRLMRCSENATDRSHWKEVIAHRDDVLLEDFELFRDFLVAEERREALVHLSVRLHSGKPHHQVEFGEPVYLAYLDQNPEYDTSVLRYGYTSLTTPRSIYDYDLSTRSKLLLKREPVVGDFDPGSYRTERVWAVARDGVRVPVSVVHRAETPRDGTAPLLVAGYGAYGISNDPVFRSPLLSLLDRGFVVAIAHVRGGEEMGRAWYEDGKLLNKKNTFTDFIDCTECLVREKYGASDRVFALGGSAGGLLIGAVINERPDLFKGVVADVPFVDVVTTMLDESIPLTTSEYDEWGNPNERPYYDYILSYSPYDNVSPKRYPNLLVLAGLHDSQVQYWEPAKWVAKLRALKKDHNLLLLKTDMDAGHGGASGRFKRHRETALTYAFFLRLAAPEPARNSPSGRKP